MFSLNKYIFMCQKHRLNFFFGNIRDNPYYFFRGNQEKVNSKIYSLIQSDLTVNGCDWQILAGNHERTVLHRLTRDSYSWSSGNILGKFCI